MNPKTAGIRPFVQPRRVIVCPCGVTFEGQYPPTRMFCPTCIRLTPSEKKALRRAQVTAEKILSDRALARRFAK